MGMGELLYIQASPRVERSHSIAVANAFVNSYQLVHPDDEIVEMNLFEYALPPFDGLAVQAKYRIMHGEEATSAERAAWTAVEQIIEDFKSADKYVLAVPMWNFGIPYRLKHYIDILVQPTYTFEVNSDGSYTGLVTGKPIFIAAARGGEYPPGSELEAYDCQKPCLEGIIRLLGFTDIRWVILEPTVHGTAELRSARRDEAMQLARVVAREF
jgi:FMN-dependent NADH-azoreductase